MKKILILIIVFIFLKDLYAQSNVQFFYKDTNFTGLKSAIQYQDNYYLLDLLRDTRILQMDVIDRNANFLYSKLIDTIENIPFVYYGTLQNKLLGIESSFYFPTFKWYNGFYHFTPCMVHIDTAGNKQIWDYTFNNPTQLLYYDQLKNHYIYAQGETNRDTANPNYMVTTGVIMQLDTSGAELWRYNYTPSGTYRNAPAGIRATPDSGCVALFYIGPWSAYSTARLIKLDKNGQLQWQKNLPIPQGMFSMQLIDYVSIDSSLLLLNFPGQYSTEKQSLLYKIDRSSQIIWTANRDVNIDSFKVWNGTDSIYQSQYTAGGWAWIKASNGKGYIGAGANEKTKDGECCGIAHRGGYVTYLNDSGRREWEATYYSADHGMQNFGFTSINTTSDGGYILTGNGTDTAGHQIGILVKIDSMGCLTADSCETRLISSITYYSATSPTISLYPNPATSTLHLAIQDNKKYDIAFYNLMGQKVHAAQIENSAKIDVRQWERGIYFYQLLQSGKQVGSGKVLRE